MRDPLVTLEVLPGRVALLTLRRPERLNAISAELADALGACLDDAQKEAGVAALVLSGEGRAFCAGADINALSDLESGEQFAAFVDHLGDAFDRLANCPKPSVAALHGVALGGGFELAMACDLRVAEQGTRIGVPEITLGLLPGAGGTARLPRLVPRGVAAEMLLTGESLGVADARLAGLINRVVATGEAKGSAIALAERLARLPALALAEAKSLLAFGVHRSLEEAMAEERSSVKRLFDTEDRAEGIGAFLSRRDAQFRGR